MTEIVMPRLSDTMEEGTILQWLKSDGEHVARGEELVEIETDKATMVYESDSEGTLQIVADVGATLAVGELIAHIGGAAAPRGGAETSPAAEASDGSGPSPEADGADTPAGGGGASAGGGAPAVGNGLAGAPAAAEPGDSSERIRASPLARRLARERGLDLAAIAGTGPGGRVVRADVEAAGQAPPAGAAAPVAEASPAAATSAPAAATAAPAAPVAPPAGTAADSDAPARATVEGVARAKGETTVEPLTRTQQTIARRMAESKATIPDFSIVVDVDMDGCVALRTELKALTADEAPTYNDMVVKACALALREHPRVNGSYRDGAVELHSRVNVGVAVAVERALVVPTVFDADSKALGEIARETRTLAARVRDASITPPELGGGTFTVSNLGMFGVRSFSAIINPPQAAILSVGALERRAVIADDGAVSARNVLALTLVCDHRVLYGADAARFAARVRELLEAPAALTL